MLTKGRLYLYVPKNKIKEIRKNNMCIAGDKIKLDIFK